ncbi:MAG: DNA integrity scanning protein DisA nucleotide-binding domain protein [Planctomycetia bacterium]|nr:DNA integrity scanning protein DisA nucleotide-binding domain protein [Planctomycetia bacterium]
MTPQKFPGQFEALFDLAVELCLKEKVDAIVLLVDGPLDWHALKQHAPDMKVIVAADAAENLEGATDATLLTVVLETTAAAVHEKLSQALLQSVADELIEPGCSVVALYSGFESQRIDSVSLIQLADHLGRLTVRDLQQIKTRVPLETLQSVLMVAVEIGREGREGKPVGTMFVVGDHRKVLRSCHPQGFDPVRGYGRVDRNIRSARVREALKEIAQMDGAFIVASDGTVEAACQYVDAPAANVTLSKGLGARHWAAAGISRATTAIAVTVSESSGTVRLFQNGEVILRIEPFRRPMKWKEFEYERPESASTAPRPARGETEPE